MYQQLRNFHLIFIYIIMIAARLHYCEASGLGPYIDKFEDFKIKEKSSPIPGVTRDLQYSVDYIRDPCKMVEIAETAPMLAVDELQRQYKESKKALLSQDQFEKSRNLYHKMILEGYLLTACLIRVEFGKEKAEEIIEKWVSGYGNTDMKNTQEQNLKSVLDIAESAINQQQCRHWVVMATRYGDFDVPATSTVQTTVDYLTEKLEIGSGSLAKIGPASGSITLKCLQSAGLSKKEQDRLSALVGVGLAFTYELIGGVMSRELGHHGSADLLRVIAHELNRATYLERDEIKKRVKFLVSGYRQSDMCKTVKSDLDCIEVVEADFTMHTPGDKKRTGVHATDAKLAMKHPVAPDAKKQPAAKQQMSLARLEQPGKAQQGMAQIGMGLKGQLGHLEELFHSHETSPGLNPLSQQMIDRVTEATRHQHHQHHILTTGDQLMQKVQNMDNPLVHAIMENKNPRLVAMLEDSGNPQLLQSLLNKPKPMNKQTQSPHGGLDKLLAAFNGNRHGLLAAIKARAKLKMLAYLKKQGHQKFMEYLKTRRQHKNLGGNKEQQQSWLAQGHQGTLAQGHQGALALGHQGAFALGHLDDGLLPDKHPEHLMHLAGHTNPDDPANIIPEAQLELLKATEQAKQTKRPKGKTKPKTRPDFMTPNKDILEELKVELGGLKQAPKPKKEYFDNTLVHFGDDELDMPTNDHTRITHNGDRGEQVLDLHEVHDSHAFQDSHEFHNSHAPQDSHYFHDSHASQGPPGNGEFRPHIGRPLYQHRQYYRPYEWQTTNPGLLPPSLINAEHTKTNNDQINVYPPRGQTHSGESLQHVNMPEPTHLKSYATVGSKSAATAPDVVDNEKQSNIKNILSGFSTKNIDENDMESVMSNLPGIIGHHVEKNEVNNILSGMEKSPQQTSLRQTNGVLMEGQADKVTDDSHQQFLPGKEEGQAEKVTDISHQQFLPGKVEEQAEKVTDDSHQQFLPDKEEGQAEKVTDDSHQQFLPGKVEGPADKPVEVMLQANRPESDQIKELTSEFSRPESGLAATSRPQQPTNRFVTTPQTMETSNEGPKTAPYPLMEGQNRKHVPVQQKEAEQINYAGVTEPDDKARPEILNLDGGIDGLEGLDNTRETQGLTEHAEPDIDGDVNIGKPVGAFMKTEPLGGRILDEMDDGISTNKHVSEHALSEEAIDKFAEGVDGDMSIGKHLSEHVQAHQAAEPIDHDLNDVDIDEHINEHAATPKLSAHIQDDIDEGVSNSKHIGAHANPEEEFETMEEMNHQEDFDKSALKHDKKPTSQLNAGNSVGSSYLETLEGLDEQPRLRKLNAENKHSPSAPKSLVSDVMSQIAKQDAVDQQYDRNYYKSSDAQSPDGMSQLFSDAINYEEVTGEKKWLKGQQVKGQQVKGQQKSKRGKKLRIVKGLKSRLKHREEADNKKRGQTLNIRVEKATQKHQQEFKVKHLHAGVDKKTIYKRNGRNLHGGKQP